MENTGLRAQLRQGGERLSAPDPRSPLTRRDEYTLVYLPSGFSHRTLRRGRGAGERVGKGKRNGEGTVSSSCLQMEC